LCFTVHKPESSVVKSKSLRWLNAPSIIFYHSSNYKNMTKPNLLHVVKSVIAAVVGVQSDKNREVDFKHGSLSAYLIVGLIVTLLFIFAVAKVATWAAGQ